MVQLFSRKGRRQTAFGYELVVPRRWPRPQTKAPHDFVGLVSSTPWSTSSIVTFSAMTKPF